MLEPCSNLYPFDGLYPDDGGGPFVYDDMLWPLLNDDDEVIELIAHFIEAIDNA